MAIDLSLLQPTFRSKVWELLDKCKEQGVIMRPNEGLRTPLQQARYWRQSRSPEQIAAAIARLKHGGAHFLAKCIESAGPQYGPPVTNALPGYSWHQWGEALDCYWQVDGEVEWSPTRIVKGKNGYKVYTQVAASIGLNAGGLWTSLKDWPHVQLSVKNSPGEAYTLMEIEGAMKERFQVLL
ncbi:MAG: M15 family metallopeptidase [Bacteroidetes bacterium]|nr:M15 family metallopeptidase [Bacteroidota bacterium]